VYTIETQITRDGAAIWKGEWVDKRERLTRRKYWETVDEDLAYSGRQLDRDIVNPSTIRTILREVRRQLPPMFPDRLDGSGRFEVPKMLIFAKTDSHAEDIIEIVREEFEECNDFCKKITYQSQEDPKTLLSQFRNAYHPRIAVTVDMIATGTDIRPLEVLLFMRDVRSRSYYEQMKGRGTRTCSLEELRAKASPSAKHAKDHFVIIDAVGVEQSQKTDSRPLEKAPSVPLKELLERIAVGDRSAETMETLAGRLLRLDKEMDDRERQAFREKAGGLGIPGVVRQLLDAHDPDTREAIEARVRAAQAGAAPVQIEERIQEECQRLLEEAVAVFHHPGLRAFLVEVRRRWDQVIDTVNLDSVTRAGWVEDQEAAAAQLASDFKDWMAAHKDEITALQIFYDQPYRRREVTFQMVRDLREHLLGSRPSLAPMKVWEAFAQLEKTGEKPKNELMALVSLLRRVAGIDAALTPFDKTVSQNFATWVWKKQEGAGHKFTREQMDWLYMMRDHIAASAHLERDDLDLTPFDAAGGSGRMWQLFGAEMDSLMEELNEALVA
jgi:type I restriction enzyme R subunit